MVDAQAVNAQASAAQSVHFGTLGGRLKKSVHHACAEAVERQQQVGQKDPVRRLRFGFHILVWFKRHQRI